MKYKRVLLKLSGEALMGHQKYGIDSDVLSSYAQDIKSIVTEKCQIAIVIGGGNIYRGVQSEKSGFDRVQGDHMGMLATIINGMALQSALESLDIETRLQTAITMEQIAEPYIRRRAIRHLEKNRVVIFGGGTGNPYFTTDTAATLRAIEMKCEAIFKATKVDGIYDKDPILNPEAKYIEKISYDSALQENLKVMDASAIALARDNCIPIIVFSLFETDDFLSIVEGMGRFSLVN